MDLLKLKLLMEQLLDITECINKENKPLLTLLLAFLPGLEDYYTELNLIQMRNLGNSLRLLKDQ